MPGKGLISEAPGGAKPCAAPGTASAAIAQAARALADFAADPGNAARVERAADDVARSLRAGGKVLVCGNGGSACDAMHVAEELTGRFRRDRAPLAAIACTDPGHLTCTANDYGFQHVFARWVEALGRPGDVLIVLSTSGNSANVNAAVDAARRRGLLTMALLGRGGGALRGRCEHEWIVGLAGGPLEADRIQELHMLVLHALVECVEARLFPETSHHGGGTV